MDKAMEHNHNGSWTGLFVTLALWLISGITMSGFVMVCTALAGLSTFAYNIYRFIKERKK